MRIALFLICWLCCGITFAQPQRIERNVARSKATLAQALSESSWKDGELVTTQGYTTAGDGGGNVYRYRRTGRSLLPIGAVDGGFYLNGPGSDDYFEAVDQTVADLRKFGAVGDGSTDDAARIAAAIATGKDVVIPDKSVYRIVTGVTLQAGQRLRAPNGGTIKYTPAGAYASAVTLLDGCSVDGVTFQGNGVATDHTGEVYTGAAVGGSSRENVLVTNCQFKDFLFDNTTSCVVGFISCRGVNISNNFFDRSNDNGTGISISYRVADAIISGNISYGRFDVWAAISAVGGDPIDPPVGSGLKDTEHHIIINNIAICGGGEPSATGREGINVHYNGGSSYAVIKDNVLANWHRHGVYLRGANTVGDPTGPNVVSGNIIRYCGGLDGGSTDYTVNSGIKAESTLPCIIADNIIDDTGYDTNGTVRTYACAGIEVARVANNLTLRGNKIRNVNGSGILLSPTVGLTTGTYHLDQIDVDGNDIINPTESGICIGQSANPGIPEIGSVAVRGNSVTLSSTATYGIGFSTPNAVSVMRFTCTDNKVKGSDVVDDQIGIVVNNTNLQGMILHNIVENVASAFGARVVNNASVATGYIAHRYIGESVWIDYNQIISCTRAYSLAATGATAASFVGDSNQYTDTANTVYGTASYGRPYSAKRLGVDGSNSVLLSFNADAVPTGSAYVKGDRLTVRSPNAGAFYEYVCTTAGSPGTWSAINSLVLQNYDTPSLIYDSGILVDRAITSGQTIYFPPEISTGYYSSNGVTGSSLPYNDGSFDKHHRINFVTGQLDSGNLNRRLIGNSYRWNAAPGANDKLKIHTAGADTACTFYVFCYDASGVAIDNSGTPPVTCEESAMVYDPISAAKPWRTNSTLQTATFKFSSAVRRVDLLIGAATLRSWNTRYFGASTPVITDFSGREPNYLLSSATPTRGQLRVGQQWRNTSGQVVTVTTGGWATNGVWAGSTAVVAYEHRHVGSSGTRTIWEATTAGTTGATPLDATGLSVGDTFSDGTITWTYLGSYELAQTVANISLLDEDDFVSNSATSAPSQQSVKTYVDARHGHAQISIEDNATATTVASTQSDWSAKSQFVEFGTNFASSSNATPDHTNDHITLTSAGVWEVSCVLTCSGSVVSDLWELALWKNNGATQISTKQGVNIRGAGLTYENQVTISSLVDASANDTIELWVQRTNGTGTLTITNAVMTAKKVSD